MKIVEILNLLLGYDTMVKNFAIIEGFDIVILSVVHIMKRLAGMSATNFLVQIRPIVSRLCMEEKK